MAKSFKGKLERDVFFFLKSKKGKLKNDPKLRRDLLRLKAIVRKSQKNKLTLPTVGIEVEFKKGEIINLDPKWKSIFNLHLDVNLWEISLKPAHNAKVVELLKEYLPKIHSIHINIPYDERLYS